MSLKDVRDGKPDQQQSDPRKVECKPLCKIKFPELPTIDPYNQTCTCPTSSAASTDCFDALIKEQANMIAAADKLKPLKAELEAIQTKAKAASVEYTQEKWKELCELWKERDCCIVQIIKRLECSIPNWDCLTKCYLCPLLHELHVAEQKLGDSSTALPCDCSNLYNLKYWAERNRVIALRQLQQISDVLKVWDKPVAALEKALAENAKLIQDIEKALGLGDPKVIYDIFVKLIPRHLAMAPVDGDTKTKIDCKYIDFCCFDSGDPDTCCGPNVGRLSLRERLIGPMPYLIDPKEFAPMICRLAQNRYLPAMNNAASAEGFFVGVEDQIRREKTRIEKGLKDFEADAKSRLPSKSESCCKDPEKPVQGAEPKPNDDPCKPEKDSLID
jgi:hypothetical protein